jgi:transposase
LGAFTQAQFSVDYTISMSGFDLRQGQEMFIPLSHRPGHAQADFGEADGYIGGKKVRFHYFCMDLPHSDGCFVKAYPAETAEAFCDGHVAAFDFFGGVPRSILYDNTKLASLRDRERREPAAREDVCRAEILLYSIQPFCLTGDDARQCAVSKSGAAFLELSRPECGTMVRFRRM